MKAIEESLLTRRAFFFACVLQSNGELTEKIGLRFTDSQGTRVPEHSIPERRGAAGEVWLCVNRCAM